jgi:type IV pilus assembly protein PilZ
MATTTKNPQGPAVATADLEEPDPQPRRDDRRSYDRYAVEWAVDCIAEDTFLYASIANISAMGIFVKTVDPLIIGTRLVLSFEPPGYEPFKLEGEVAWINVVRADGDNPNPGMGVRFVNLHPDDRERLVEVIRTIAYVREPS